MSDAGESYDDITDTTAHLPIPHEAVRVFRERCPDVDPVGMDDAETMDLIEAVALPVVAGELRRLADAWIETQGSGEALLTYDECLNKRAEQLEAAAQDTTGRTET